MDTKFTYFFDFRIPYYKNKYLKFTLIKMTSDKRFVIRFTIWKECKLVDIKGYEDEYGLTWWKHFTIIDIKKNKRGD